MTRYITTTLPYVNAAPHIGFALELVQTDTLVRFWESHGDEVFFNTGTDEHGQKIFDAAEKAGADVKEYVGRYADEFRKLKRALGLSNSVHFIRTTDENHMQAAREMWKRCDTSGDIYKKEFEGLYCVGCEKFLAARDIEGGMCAIHMTKPKLLREENYFFRFSKYQEKLLAYLSHEYAVIPEWRREEAVQFVKEGLEDFSISREKSRLSWGIPVPGDDTQVMYVWFDALTNYISTLGWPDEGGDFKKFWQEGYTVQMAGKDQVRFQSLMWQAMLMSAGIKNTDQIFYHGFINSGGQKMSKSLGNVISPYALVEKYGTEATRYLLLRHVHATEDSDVTWEKLDEWYTANLVNGLGNLVARVMQMAVTHLSEPVRLNQQTQTDPDIGIHMESFEFNRAADRTWERIGHNDALIALEKPFEGIKSKDIGKYTNAKVIIEKLVRELHAIATELEAFMPGTSKRIKEAVLEHKKPENLFPRLG